MPKGVPDGPAVTLVNHAMCYFSPPAAKTLLDNNPSRRLRVVQSTYNPRRFAFIPDPENGDHRLTEARTMNNRAMMNIINHYPKRVHRLKLPVEITNNGLVVQLPDEIRLLKEDGGPLPLNYRFRAPAPAEPPANVWGKETPEHIEADSEEDNDDDDTSPWW